MLKKFASDITHGLRSMVRGVDADWDFNERRRCLRFQCRHKVEMLQGENEAKSVAYVLNYGIGGVRIAFPGNLKVGERVKLRFPHPLPGYSVKALECEVVWRRKNSKSLEMLAGLKFVETKERMASSWIAYFFRERGASLQDLKENRKHVRAVCKLSVVARGEEDRAVGEVYNIGLGGLFMKINRPSEVGDTWLLDITGVSNFPGLHFSGRVLSCDPDSSGMYGQRISFQQPDEETIKLLRKYLLALTKDFWTD